MKNEETLASYNLTYNDVFGMNVTYKLSGIHVPTDVYDKGTFDLYFYPASLTGWHQFDVNISYIYCWRWIDMDSKYTVEF